MRSPCGPPVAELPDHVVGDGVAGSGAEHGVDLAGEVVEQRPPGDAGLDGQVVHGEAVEPVLVGQPLGADA